jgi:hypothetical protein
MKSKLQHWLEALDTWLFQPKHREWLRTQQSTLHSAFTTHPEEAGETYLQHLWFTVRMALRFVYAGVILLTHGVFPFLLTQAASQQIEAIYRIMKTRIPKTRRDEIDIDYSV